MVTTSVLPKLRRHFTLPVDSVRDSGHIGLDDDFTSKLYFRTMNQSVTLALLGCSTGVMNFGFNHDLIEDPSHMGPPRQSTTETSAFDAKHWANASFQFAPLMVIPYKLSGRLEDAP